MLVAGGGIIGSACARAAALRGLRVIICEPGPEPTAASAASAGILAPQIEGTDESLRALGLRARELYDTLAAALAETTDIDIGLWRDGVASLAFTEAEAERLRDAVAHQRQAGLRCDWLEAADVAEHFPAAAPCLGALFAPEDGAVDAPALTRALRADAKRLGARTMATRVNRINTILGRATGVEIPAGKIKAEHVIIAAGAWSPRIEHLPRVLPVEPVRGQMAAAPWPDEMPRTVLYYDHAYVLARRGEALFGSTMEHVGFDGGVTKEGIAEIVGAAKRLLPTLPDTPTRTWSGLRPLTPDGRPIVGPDPDVRGLWYATGHGRNGVLLAGLTGQIIADLITTGTTDVDIASLDVTRFT
ncbi:MAG TPA: glycine oxidase ThiO [Gemmatimonadales bacterium]|nr:glycine oxidase ThiO [Gemmatimonadales bacterium]